jgi:glutaredoxin-like YruB-family protein
MKVKIYSTPECPFCKKAKAFFKANNIEYENIDVSANDKNLEEMKSISEQMSVPVIDIDGKILTGFDEAKLKAALGLK